MHHAVDGLAFGAALDSITPPPRKKARRRKLNRDLATAAEVLEYRAAPSESIMALLSGGLLMDMMPQSPGQTSPPLVESFFTHQAGDSIQSSR